ncbi:type II toxin-antitoxin system VapC family toxin [Occultella kanbiaonis]|uniref:type II toxin-antitoxin system VapC family toxin n=1 Tax=Occultella kanbiaonis TaxID=2675754 RepID=UPI0013D7CA3B|nr:type II toxin-antitoxin system VapC family toxin [Occultella kanbiaonis]
MPDIYLVDTAVFAYALGLPHERRDACRRIVELAAEGEVELHASVEMVQELLHHRMRRTQREAAVRQARAVADLCVLHPFDAAVLARALDLVSRTSLRGRDAVHAATATVNGIARLLSSDPDFDGVPGLVRVDPGDLG